MSLMTQHIPDAPCIEYLPTFAPQNHPVFVGNYTIHEHLAINVFMVDFSATPVGRTVLLLFLPGEGYFCRILYVLCFRDSDTITIDMGGLKQEEYLAVGCI